MRKINLKYMEKKICKCSIDMSNNTEFCPCIYPGNETSLPKAITASMTVLSDYKCFLFAFFRLMLDSVTINSIIYFFQT